MPVSFNVPKTTKRSKFVVDQFKGVDFTNAGIDVDPTRSPYAPNMVRHTPGKVRKRMGYSKEIQFGSYTNVNLAKDTSAEEREILINESNVGQTISIYDCLERISAGSSDITVYYEFDYSSPNGFDLAVAGYTIPASEEWTHYSGTRTLAAGKSFSHVNIISNTEQEIFIKNFAVMKAKDSNYKWSPAPKQFIEDSGTNHFYGHHAYRALINDNKQSTVNINRALNTGSTLQGIQLTTSYDPIYELCEYVYRNTDNTIRRKLYVDFWYAATDDFRLSIAGSYVVVPAFPGTVGEPYNHYSFTINCGSYSDKMVKVRADADSGGYNFLWLYNFYVGCAKDDNYVWRPAPEETYGENFTPNLYYEGKRNYTSITNDYYSRTYSSATASHTTTVIPADATSIDDIKGFCFVSFEITCTSTSTTGFENAEIYCTGRNGNLLTETLVTVDSIPTKYKYVVYTSVGSASEFASGIGVTLHFSSSASRTCSFSFENIEIRSISPRDAFNSVDPNYDILHIGSKFWLKANNNVQQMNTNANLRRSWSVQMGDDLILLDGKDIYAFSFGNAHVDPIADYYCYIPTITISKKPSGGGTSYEPLNMMSPGFIETFNVSSDEASATQFQLSFGNLDSTTVRAWQLYGNGTWAEHIENVAFTVNRTTGVVTFANPPGVTPISGEDNVKIQAYRTVAGYRDKIAKCRFGAVYGVNGRPDRLFVGGNPAYPSQDFFSEQNNYTYFPDVNYSNLGSSAGEITGYAKVGNYLGTFKKENDYTNSLILREGTTTTQENGSTETIFRIVNTLQGEGMVSPFSAGYLGGEPLYLSKKGVFAVTASDGTDSKYGQNRSFYLNGKLQEETGLEEGYCTVFNDMYILSLNNKFYILDGLQPAVSENDPYSTRQYSGFYCTDIPATCIWNDGDNLYFGTADGKLCKFYTSPDDVASYNDDGYPISAWWETPDLDGYYFYKNKTFRYFAIRLMKAFRTSFKLYAEKYSVWSFIKEDDATGRAFDFTRIDFSDFSFSTDWSEKLAHTKLRIKKVDKARFKIENSRLNQPFGIYDLALEYIENGNYKR